MVCLGFSNSSIKISGKINQVLSIDSTVVRSCPEFIDSCLYICSNGEINPCHPNNLYPITIDTNSAENGTTPGSRYRIFFPWEYNNMSADKFVVTASWPCLSPSAVYASGDYAYWDIYGNENCPGTIQGVIWYGDNCEDDEGNIGSDDCDQLVGRFCFVAGDTLNWPLEADQSVSTDICDACWMSEPAWNDYNSQQYSDPLLSPEFCNIFDHCHHSTPENIHCGVGYLDEVDSTSVSINRNHHTPKIFSISNYPNPFNPVTSIKYYLSRDIYVNITIYDMLGNKIKNIINQNQKSGYKSVQWNATDNQNNPVSSGVYLYSIEAEDFRKINKMIFLK